MTIRQIIIVPYNPQWPHEFDQLAAVLRHALGDLALRIDHIGSTAVPNLAAKDVIDIQVTVHDLVPEVEARLATIGYARQPHLVADHRPPTVEGPDSEWDKWVFKPAPAQRPTNLHVRVAGRANQRYPLLFRDYLRSHPVAAQAYDLIKQELARANSTDWDLYYAVKDPVCDVIWDAAEAWAQATGWTLPPSDG